jgi:hypothetical protein
MKITQRIQNLEARRTKLTDHAILLRVRRVAPGLLDQPSGELRCILARGVKWLRADDESEEQFRSRVITETENQSGNAFVCCVGFDHDGSAPANAPMDARG